MKIDGSVKPGFEPVRALYEHNMSTLNERSTQLCVYHKGEKVVDLWATGESDFTPDSLVNVFSSGKSLESIAMASLLDKGLITYSDKISHHWPEFAANGKDDLTIADLMRHEAGLASFDTSLDPADLHADKIKENAVGRVIEKQNPKFPKGGGKREYHAITRGWIANEIFRRVDPQSRTIGEFLRAEVSTPLDADVYIGLRDEELPRVAKGKAVSLGFVLKESLKPKFLGRRIEHNIFQLLGRFIRLLPMVRNVSANAVPPFKGMKDVGIFNDPMVAKGETPSANTHATARGLAKVASMMAMRGRSNEQQVMAENTWVALHDAPQKSPMLIMNTVFAQGGVAAFGPCDQGANVFERGLNEGREGFHGWMGLGGSVLQWHPEQEIGFGYVPTSLYAFDLANERAKAYQAEVLRCVEKLGWLNS